MGKHIKTSALRPAENPTAKNWKRRQRRKRLKARREYMAGWVDRAPVSAEARV